MTLEELVAAIEAQAGGDSFELAVPPNWTQGRTMYGGMTAALALACARAAMPDLPPLRSAQVAFVGPVEGRVTLSVKVLRRGRSASFVQVDAQSGDQCAAAVTFVFAEERDSVLDWPEVVEPIETGDAIELPEFLVFARNYDHWFTGEKADLSDRFVRLKEGGNVHPEVELVAAADLLPPPVLFRFPSIVRLSSMTWQIDLTAPARQSADRRWRLRSDIEHYARGLETQVMRMWDGDGRLVACGRQLVVMFG